MSVVPSTRRGACPGLDTPMQTGDGLMVRFAPASGAFSASELREVATLAARHGNGILEVSRRGNLQIRGLDVRSAPLFSQGIAQAGIVVGSGTAIDISPLSGIDPVETADARPLAGMISKQLEASAWTSGLAPKVSVVIDGGGQISLADQIADIRLVARGGYEGWQLYIGDTVARSRHVGLLQSNDHAAKAVITLLEQLAAMGDTARGRSLGDADISKIDQRVSGSTLHNHDCRNTPSVIGVAPLNNGCYGVGFGLELGTIRVQDLISFADLVTQATSDHGAGNHVNTAPIRLAPNKIMIVVMPDALSAQALANGARELGLICDAGDPRLGFVTCAGAPACASAYIDTHKLAQAILSDCCNLQHGTPGTNRQAAGRGQIHISGCDKCCAKPRGAILDVIGAADGCAVIDNGRVLVSCIAPLDVPVVIRDWLLSHDP